MKRFFALFLVLLLSACGAPLENRDFVEVSGEGSVETVADVFRVNATATARGKDADALKSEVDAQVNDVLEALKKAGVADKDISALQLHVQPEWQWQPERKLIGYVASRNIEITIRGMERYGAVLGALTRAGITEIQPGGSEIGDERAVRDEALAAAMKDAHERARTLARAGDRRLGEVRMIVESGSSLQAPRMMEMSAMAKSDEARYMPGTSTVTARVQVRYELR